MNYVRLRIEAEEPLIITDGSAESMGHTCLGHIPGNMLLGAYAQAWKEQHKGQAPDASPEFAALFLGGGVSWGHAYPVLGDLACVPVPLSFRKDKSRGNLPQPGEEGGFCHVYDLLEVTDQEDIRAKGSDEQVKLKSLSDKFMRPDNFVCPSGSSLWNMHVAIEAKGRKAAESQLFGYASLPPGGVFECAVNCASESQAKMVLDLVASKPQVRVGHSRSAGYGGVRCTASLGGTATGQADLKAGTHTLYLLSDYIPAHSWQDPAQALVSELEQALAVHDLVIEKQFCSHLVIAGFNSLWRLPRRSRQALGRGSVLRVRWQGQANNLPAALGGWQQEGYGRILLDPAFLGNARIMAGSLALTGARQAQAATRDDPLLRAIRRRALARKAQKAATAFVNLPQLDRFVDSVAGNDKPSQSQRGNLRQLIGSRPSQEWSGHFRSTLGKTAGEQWKNAEAIDPYLTPFQDGKWEELHEIMLKLLSPDKFFAVGSLPEMAGLLAFADNLPGGAADAAELEIFKADLHRLALLELLNIWEKTWRARDGKEATC